MSEEKMELIFAKNTKSGRLAQLLAGELFPLQSTREIKIGSVREIAKKYHVANSTSAKALKVLEKNGLILPKRGQGTFLRKKEADRVKIALLYTPEIYEEKDYFTTLQRAVCDYFENSVMKNNVILIKIPVTLPQNELLTKLEICDLVISHPNYAKKFQFLSTVKKVFYGMESSLLDQTENILIYGNYPAAMRQFLKKHDLSRYEKILFMYVIYPASSIVTEMTRRTLEENHIPEKKVHELHIPATTFTARNVSRMVLAKKKELFHGEKTLLISFSCFFFEGIMEAFSREELPDLLFYGELTAAQKKSVQKKNIFCGSISAGNEVISGTVHWVAGEFARQCFFPCGTILAPLKYEQLSVRKVLE